MLSTPFQTLLDLFSSDLEGTRFGDVDASSLAALAAHVATADEAVASAQAALDAARTELAVRNEALLAHAHRALAFARVYAENNPELTARLAAITLPKPARRKGEEAAPTSTEGEPPRRPRGRPRKIPLSAPVILSAEASAE